MITDDNLGRTNPIEITLTFDQLRELFTANPISHQAAHDKGYAAGYAAGYAQGVLVGREHRGMDAQANKRSQRDPKAADQ